MEVETPAARVLDPAPKGYIEYEIDVEKILRNELPGIIAVAQAAQLTQEAVNALPERAKGAYVLYEDGHPVYAGKTDTRHGFRSRLGRHFETVQSRLNIDPAKLSFKAVRIMVFSNFDVEAILINELRRQDSTALKWNFSGFGSNDPGHNRETQEPADFDKERPIHIDRPLPFLAAGPIPLLQLLVRLKENLTYDFRYQTDPNEKGKPKRHTVGESDHRAAGNVELPDQPVTMRDALKIVLMALPRGWRATIFPNRVILYREQIEYQYAREYLEAER
jgi:hypothetical protein